MDKEKRVELNENDLEDVAGGVWKDSACWFMPVNRNNEKNEGGNVWLQCDSKCRVGLYYCCCHNEPHCKDRWHTINGDTKFLTGDRGNHWQKKPPTYST